MDVGGGGGIALAIVEAGVRSLGLVGSLLGLVGSLLGLVGSLLRLVVGRGGGGGAGGHVVSGKELLLGGLHLGGVGDVVSLGDGDGHDNGKDGLK
jgi:hypothetical protein